MRLLPLVLPFALALSSGCGSSVDLSPGSGDGGIGGSGDEEAAEATACAGALTSSPRRLTSDLASGWLALAGDRVVLVESESGRVLAIDRCSGALTQLATVAAPTSAAVHGDSVYVAADQGPPQLVRVPLDGSAVAPVAELDGVATVRSSGTHLVVGVRVPDATAEVPSVGMELWTLQDDGELLALRSFPAPIGGEVDLIGASPVGAYLRFSQHCGCNPGLTLVPLDGAEGGELPGTHGARHLAIQGEHVVTPSEAESIGMGSSDVDIARVPLAGGEREILQAKGAGITTDVRAIAASPTTVCWASFGGSIHCRSVGAAGPATTIDADREGRDPIAMADDALYWLQGDGAGARELVGVAID